MVTSSRTNNAEWLERAAVLAGSSLAGYRLPKEVDFVIERAEGTRVWDVDGNEYIDFLIGSGPLILGHSHPGVVRAVTEQLPKGSHYYALNRPAIELAEAIVNGSPCGERVKFVSTGSEATAYAMRLARAFTGKSKILKFEGGYHGSHDAAMMSFAPSSPADWPEAVPDSAGITEGVRKDILIAPYNDPDQTAEIAQAWMRDLAAIIVEPQQRCIPPAPGFLQALREIADEVGVLLIFDEVVTGFRLAPGGAQEFYGVKADLATYGKIIGGGYPLAAIAGRADVLDLADTARRGSSDYVHLSGTLNGNPVAAVAGLATMEELTKEGTYPRLHEAGERLRAGLRAIAANRGVSMAVIGEGPLAALHFVDGDVRTYRDVLQGDKALLNRVNTGLIKRGIMAQLSTKFYLSLAHTDQDIDRCLEAFDEALVEARA